MRIPTILAVALAAVLAGSLLLVGPLAGSNSVFHSKHSEVPKAEAAPLPLNIMERFTSKLMAGDARSGDNLKVDEEFVDPENHCEFCTRVEYTPGDQGLAGFAYRTDNSNGIDLTGAKKVQFWVMGEDGGEKLKFKVAGTAIERLQDRLGSRLTDRLPLTSGIFQSERFALTTQDVTLDNDWEKFEVDLTGVDLSTITSPFGFELAEDGGTQVFYMKGVTFDTEPAQNALLTVEEEVVEPLAAEIIANSTEGVAPATFEFEANVTGGTAESYDFAWDFGDGSGSEEQDAIHTFAEAGEYNVTLAVTDESQSASDSVLVQVAEPEVIEEEETIVEEPTDNGTEEVPSNATGVEEEEEGVGENGNSTSDATDEPAETIQSIMPEVDAGMDLFALPGDTVVMGGELAGIDPDEAEELSLSWTQESGPEAEIDGGDSINPEVTIPDDLDGDARLDLQLAATNGAAEDADVAAIFAEHVEEVEDAQEESLDPSEGAIAEWSDEGCGGEDVAECMSDGSDDTFAAASPGDASDINLFSFEELEGGDNIEIEYVAAVTTARADDPGYILMAWADSEDAEDYDEADAAVSVASDSFEEYEYVWEENPVTESPWTVDSLNSFLAGYVYAEGESDIEVSEFRLVVTYTVTPVLEEPPEQEPEVEQSGSATSSAGNGTTSE